MKTHRVSVVGAAFVLTFAYANVASAQKTAHETKGDDTADTAETANKEAEAPESGKEEGEENEPKVNLFIDGVFGFGDVPALNPNPPVTLGTAPSHTLENTLVASDSYIMGGSYRIGKNLTIGARIPIVHAAFGPENLETQRGATTIGNLEIWVAYEKKLTKQLAIIPELGIALPTAVGDELPTGDEVAGDPTKNFDNNANDRFSALQAASASRGLEESALFEAKRLGIIPKIELEYKMKKLTIAPYVKLENLISTQSDVEHRYLGEIVPGLARFVQVGEVPRHRAPRLGKHRVRQRGPRQQRARRRRAAAACARRAAPPGRWPSFAGVSGEGPGQYEQSARTLRPRFRPALPRVAALARRNVLSARFIPNHFEPYFSGLAAFARRFMSAA